MGILYLARDPALNRLVAIKVLRVSEPELLERFEREARSAASLKHHNIVTIYDVGEDHGSPFIAMEYVEGETLGELIRRKAPLTIDRKLELMLELCDGLGYAHRSGIIHRDIKPANLMIGTDAALKILDFGIARLVNDESLSGLTLAGALVGTPHYMSPEQIKGQRIDHRVDIFAVGLVCYELLTYSKPFHGEVPHSVLDKILNEEPPPMRELQPDIDPALEAAVNHAIEKNPDRRYQQLALLAVDLSRLRERLRRSASEATVRLTSKTPLPARDPLSESEPARQIPNLDAIARRRSAKLDTHLAEAAKAFDEGRFEEAIQDCEMAVLMDPSHTRALDLLKRAHQALEDNQVRDWLEQAETNLSQSALTAAAVLIDKALQLRPNLSDARRLERLLQERRREQEHARERVRIVRAAIDRAKAGLETGAIEAALRSAAEALAFEANNEEAQALRERATGLLEERRHKELEERADAAVSSARQLASAGEHQKSLALLEAFSPPHPFVERTMNEIAAEAYRIECERAAADADSEAEQLRPEAELKELEPTTVDSDQDLAPDFTEELTAAGARQAQSALPVRRPAPAAPRRRLLLIAVSLAAVVLLAAGLRLLRSTSPSADDPMTNGPALTPVTINAIPWANFRIVPRDGRSRPVEGTTPFVVLLSKGEYTIEFRNDLFQPTSQSLTVGERPQSVTAAMPGASVDAIVVALLGPPQ